MNKTKFAIYAGLLFGIIDIIPMYFMDIPDKETAMVCAFINRFSIGFIIPLLNISLSGWIKGFLIGILLSVPDAIITGAYAPIMIFGIVGGLIVGIITDHYYKRVPAA